MAEASETGLSVRAPEREAVSAPARGVAEYGGPVRLVEVAVLSPDVPSVQRFVRNLCGGIDLETPGLLLGRLDLGRERALQVYGLPVQNSPETLVLDLLIARALGALLLYPWDVPFLRERAELVADWYADSYDAPLVALAFSSRGNPLPAQAYPEGVSLGAGARVVGADLDQPASLRRAIAVLVDMALGRVAT